MRKVIYKCGCEATGDNISAYCPIHGDGQTEIKFDINDLTEIEEKKTKGILKEADDIINGKRQDSYGKPENSFQIIADFWTTYLKHRGILKELHAGATYHNLTAIDVTHMMSLFKHARMIGQKPDRDNYRDACGYLAIAADRLLKT